MTPQELKDRRNRVWSNAMFYPSEITKMAALDQLLVDAADALEAAEKARDDWKHTFEVYQRKAEKRLAGAREAWAIVHKHGGILRVYHFCDSKDRALEYWRGDEAYPRWIGESRAVRVLIIPAEEPIGDPPVGEPFVPIENPGFETMGKGGAEVFDGWSEHGQNDETCNKPRHD